MLNQRENINRCIFCDGTPLSQQHLWPNWIGKNYLEPGKSKHDQLVISYNQRHNNIVQIEPKLIEKRGAFRNKKLKIVCTRCNSGWMSIIENDAKPHLIELIERKATEKTTREGEAIAKWAVLFSIVAEYSDPSTRVIHQTELSQLYRTRRPSFQWQVWIGQNHTTNKNGNYRHETIAQLP